MAEHTYTDSGITFQVADKSFYDGYNKALNDVLEKSLSLGEHDNFGTNGVSGLSMLQDWIILQINLRKE